MLTNFPMFEYGNDFPFVQEYFAPKEKKFIWFRILKVGQQWNPLALVYDLIGQDGEEVCCPLCQQR